jgi:hypothetical protein
MEASPVPGYIGDGKVGGFLFRGDTKPHTEVFANGLRGKLLKSENPLREDQLRMHQAVSGAMQIGQELTSTSELPAPAAFFAPSEIGGREAAARAALEQSIAAPTFANDAPDIQQTLLAGLRFNGQPIRDVAITEISQIYVFRTPIGRTYIQNTLAEPPLVFGAEGIPNFSTADEPDLYIQQQEATVHGPIHAEQVFGRIPVAILRVTPEGGSTHTVAMTLSRFEHNPRSPLEVNPLTHSRL